MADFDEELLVVNAFLQHINAMDGSDYEVTDRPDKSIRSEKACEIGRAHV